MESSLINEEYLFPMALLPVDGTVEVVVGREAGAFFPASEDPYGMNWTISTLNTGWPI